ncbi:hypothetical protein L1987_61710 [Smallanthus sonchifolius]|uniref:Uncharacterized protein n=1 Tax=Smallanthus sonchifolius TaxID=185202 RepID=A0ACB9C8G5_9ASTR|nr:hypothetical protein L1987_61710 [Smallanthus sonchifolius]
MKNRGKSEQDKAKLISDSNNFSSTSDLSCRKHPSSSSSVGICAFCLTEKLIKLVCSDCGEQRMSSCSCCSDLCSFRNSSCTVDVGSVGRISFLIENEKDEQKTLFSHLQLKQSETGDEKGDGVVFKRSNSCVVEVKKSNGFWKIGRLFKKKREKEGCSEKNRAIDVSRSRSLSSFMGAKISDFSESEPRMSGLRGGLVDFEDGFPVIETDLSGIDDGDDDDEFIDLKIDLCDKSKTEQSVFKKCDQVMVNDSGIKKVKNSHVQAWKWMFKHHSESNDHNHILKS